MDINDLFAQTPFPRKEPVEEKRNIGKFDVRDWAEWDLEHPYVPHPDDETHPLTYQQVKSGERPFNLGKDEYGGVHLGIGITRGIIKDGSGWKPDDPEVHQAMEQADKLMPGLNLVFGATPPTDAPADDAEAWVKFSDPTHVFINDADTVRSGWSRSVGEGKDWQMPEATPDNLGTYIVTHEIGHLDATRQVPAASPSSSANLAVSQFVEALGPNESDMDKLQNSLSKYGQSNPFEGYAEAYASYKLGGSSPEVTKVAKVMGWTR